MTMIFRALIHADRFYFHIHRKPINAFCVVGPDDVLPTRCCRRLINLKALKLTLRLYLRRRCAIIVLWSLCVSLVGGGGGSGGSLME